MNKMNRIENEQSLLLEREKRLGNIQDWRFEPMKIRLADNCTYLPDFMIVHNLGSIEFMEIKGPHIREDALIKYKVAVELYPMFLWSMWQKTKEKGWQKIR